MSAKRVTSAEWVANTSALMDAHDRVEIVDEKGSVTAIYSRPAAPEFPCCEANRAEIVRLRAALKRVGRDARDPVDSKQALRRIREIVRREMAKDVSRGRGGERS